MAVQTQQCDHPERLEQRQCGELDPESHKRGRIRRLSDLLKKSVS